MLSVLDNDYMSAIRRRMSNSKKLNGKCDKVLGENKKEEHC